jgi:hypothetical protein
LRCPPGLRCPPLFPEPEHSDALIVKLAVALWRCGAVALWRCGAVALWRCGAVALWRCGAVALYGSVSVGLVCGYATCLRHGLPPDSSPHSPWLRSLPVFRPALPAARRPVTRSDDAATDRSFCWSARCEKRFSAPLGRCGGRHGGPIWRSWAERVMFWEPQGNGRGKQKELTEQDQVSEISYRPSCETPRNSIG